VRQRQVVRGAGAALAALCATFAAVVAMAVASPASATAAGPSLSVRTAVLIEKSTGQRLFGVSPDKQVLVASTTKLMTALLTLEHVHQLGTFFTQPNYYAPAADAQIGLVPGERMSVHDLLLALLLPSAADAAEDLAFNVGHGSVAHFVGMMNARARQLGLRHTHYASPIGADSPKNYSSASDLVKLASYELSHSAYFKRVVAQSHALLRTGNHPRFVVNRNTLVGRVPWIKGVKTGHTSGAGYVLVGSGTRGGMTLLSAVTGTASESARDANTFALLSWGFDHFRLVTPVHAGEVLARPTVRDQPGLHATVIAASAFTRVLKRTARVRLRVVVPQQLAGPLRRHAVVGRVLVLENGRPIARIPLLLAQRLKAVSPFTLAARFITRPFTLVLLALALIALVSLAGVWRGRSRGRDRAGPEPA
jgi:serine-type D-Ala-D-Ala carboxypeptidase (penicillin-binding protein 5/6)